eukprot:15474011-Alexandrium_andersonii.AAC.1
MQFVIASYRSRQLWACSIRYGQIPTGVSVFRAARGGRFRLLPRKCSETARRFTEPAKTAENRFFNRRRA